MLEIIFSNVLIMSVTSVAIIALIVLVKKLVYSKLTVSWHYYIWFLLLIRLLIPYNPELSVDFKYPFQENQNEIVREEKQSGLQGDPFKTRSNELHNRPEYKSIEEAPVKFAHNNISIDYAVSQNRSNINSVEDKQLTQHVFRILSIIWAMGIVLFIFYTLLISIILSLKIKDSCLTLKEDSIQGILQECMKLTNIKRNIQIIYQKHIKAPALYGVFRPKLLLPESIVDCLDSNEIKYIILHELCHYKRKDIIVGTVQLILNMTHWFNPFIWYAFLKINEDREPVCDKLVLNYIPQAEHRKYGETLIKVLEIYSQNYRSPGIASIVQGRMINMERRLRFISMFRKKRSTLGFFITFSIIFASLFSVAFISNKMNFMKPVEAKAAVGGEVSSENIGGIFDRKGVELVQRISTEKSSYPFKNLASHIIGYRNDTRGVSGIEAVLDSYGANSNNITLTIDKNIQEITDVALDKAQNEYKAKGGAAIIIDPSTGEILAMSSKPDFDLNTPFSIPKGMDSAQWRNMSDEEQKSFLNINVFRNKAIAAYEPGSTFKAITAAAGLEEGIVQSSTMVNDSAVTLGAWTINCWNPNRHGVETFEQAINNSCNPVFVRISQSIGIDKYYKYVRNFGFYDKTGFGLLGEEESITHVKPNQVDMAVASIGQRIKITPMQLAAAYSAIANGGNLIKPQIVKKVSDFKGQTVKEFEPQIVRELMSKETSDTLKALLEGVVSKGTGRNAYIQGYKIAGKTGTSEKHIGKESGYIASFAGFAPADNPRIVGIVLLDEPQVQPHTGGTTAAPVFGRLVKDVLDYISKN
ncbi:MAG: penicillin-binding transpeptidase domain-containing protein [Clostridia bacterium]|nr:penicillin-binding transpeptidase domain-containing protein [Clostridia bacterium]